jgi:hypothetical protein
VRAGLLILLAAALLAAQDRTAAGSGLAEAVEAYLAATGEAEAARLLERILSRPDATPEGVLAAVQATPRGPIPDGIQVPWRDQLLQVRLRWPAGHGREGPRLPLVLDISGGNVADQLGLLGVIVAAVPAYTPPEFSDEGRDAFLKVLQAAAHAAHGDPARLWLCGYSWAAHASYDTALHRPGWIRGLIALGGGPRRVHFRLLPNLRSTRVLGLCGRGDDPELVWNLEELRRLAPKHGVDFDLVLDPQAGHSLPLRGQERASSIVLEAPPGPGRPAAQGLLLADAPLVATPWLAVLQVDGKRTEVPARVPVPASLDRDGQRRATLRAMENQVARFRWRHGLRGEETVLDFELDGVRAAEFRPREPWLVPGARILVRARGKVVFQGEVRPEPRAILESARAEGTRIHPALMRLSLR